MRRDITSRLAKLEGPPPRMKSRDAIFLGRCTDAELIELGPVLEKKERGEAWTAEEERFVESLLAKYHYDDIPAEGEPW